MEERKLWRYKNLLIKAMDYLPQNNRWKYLLETMIRFLFSKMEDTYAEIFR